MAKKEKQKKEFDYDEAQKRMAKYVKSCESEKKGKTTVISMIGFSVLCFIVVLIIVLKLSGVGTTVVFNTDEAEGSSEVSVYTSPDAQGTTLADFIAENISGAVQ